MKRTRAQTNDAKNADKTVVCTPVFVNVTRLPDSAISKVPMKEENRISEKRAKWKKGLKQTEKSNPETISEIKNTSPMVTRRKLNRDFLQNLNCSEKKEPVEKLKASPLKSPSSTSFVSENAEQSRLLQQNTSTMEKVETKEEKVNLTADLEADKKVAPMSQPESCEQKDPQLASPIKSQSSNSQDSSMLNPVIKKDESEKAQISTVPDHSEAENADVNVTDEKLNSSFVLDKDSCSRTVPFRGKKDTFKSKDEPQENSDNEMKDTSIDKNENEVFEIVDEEETEVCRRTEIYVWSSKDSVFTEGVETENTEETVSQSPSTKPQKRKMSIQAPEDLTVKKSKFEEENIPEVPKELPEETPIENTIKECYVRLDILENSVDPLVIQWRLKQIFQNSNQDVSEDMSTESDNPPEIENYSNDMEDVPNSNLELETNPDSPNVAEIKIESPIDDDFENTAEPLLVEKISTNEPSVNSEVDNEDTMSDYGDLCIDESHSPGTSEERENRPVPPLLINEELITSGREPNDTNSTNIVSSDYEYLQAEKASSDVPEEVIIEDDDQAEMIDLCEDSTSSHSSKPSDSSSYIIPQSEPVNQKKSKTKQNKDPVNSTAKPSKANKKKERNSDSDSQKDSYKCVFCKVDCKALSKLKLHLERKHPKYYEDKEIMKKNGYDFDVSMECNVCKMKFDTKENLFDHIIKHTETELQEAYKTNAQAQNMRKDAFVEVIEKNKKQDTIVNNVQSTANDEDSDVIEVRVENEVRNEHLPEKESSNSVVLSQSVAKENDPANDITQVEFICKEKFPTGICACHAQETSILSNQELQLEVVFSCNTCNVLFRRRDCLEIHYRTNTACALDRISRSVKILCSKCLCSMDSLPEMRAHMKKHEDMLRDLKITFVCDICKIVFYGSGSSFYNHWFNHNKDPGFSSSKYSFPKNSIILPTEIDMSLEARNIRQDYMFVAEHACKSCSKPFYTAMELDLHNTKPCEPSKDDHQVEKFDPLNFYCKLCNEVFLSKSLFDQHTIAKNHAPCSPPQYLCLAVTPAQVVYVCSICQTINQNELQLKNHWTKHRLLREYFTCTLCTTFKKGSFSGLDEHFKRWHKSTSIKCSVEFLEAVHCCKICKIGFDNVSEFQEHELTHVTFAPSSSNEIQILPKINNILPVPVQTGNNQLMIYMLPVQKKVETILPTSDVALPTTTSGVIASAPKVVTLTTQTTTEQTIQSTNTSTNVQTIDDSDDVIQIDNPTPVEKEANVSANTSSSEHNNRLRDNLSLLKRRLEDRLRYADRNKQLTEPEKEVSKKPDQVTKEIRVIVEPIEKPKESTKEPNNKTEEKAVESKTSNKVSKNEDEFLNKDAEQSDHSSFSYVSSENTTSNDDKSVQKKRRGRPKGWRKVRTSSIFDDNGSRPRRSINHYIRNYTEEEEDSNSNQSSNFVEDSSFVSESEAEVPLKIEHPILTFSEELAEKVEVINEQRNEEQTKPKLKTLSPPFEGGPFEVVLVPDDDEENGQNENQVEVDETRPAKSNSPDVDKSTEPAESKSIIRVKQLSELQARVEEVDKLWDNKYATKVNNVQTRIEPAPPTNITGSTIIEPYGPITVNHFSTNVNVSFEDRAGIRNIQIPSSQSNVAHLYNPHQPTVFNRQIVNPVVQQEVHVTNHPSTSKTMEVNPNVKIQIPRLPKPAAKAPNPENPKTVTILNPAQSANIDNSNSYSCSFCMNFSSKSLNEMHEHMLTRCPNKKMYVQSQQSKNKDLQLQRGQLFECLYCMNFKTTDIVLMQMHRKNCTINKRLYPEIRPKGSNNSVPLQSKVVFVCKYCPVPRVFDSNLQHNQHVREVHGHLPF